MWATAGLHLRCSLWCLVAWHHRHRAGRWRPAPVWPASNESPFQNTQVILNSPPCQNIIIITGLWLWPCQSVDVNENYLNTLVFNVLALAFVHVCDANWQNKHGVDCSAARPTQRFVSLHSLSTDKVFSFLPEGFILKPPPHSEPVRPVREAENISLHCHLKVKSNCLSSPDSSCISTYRHNTLSVTVLKGTHIHTRQIHTVLVVCVCSGVVLYKSHHTAFSKSMWLLQSELQAVCSHFPLTTPVSSVKQQNAQWWCLLNYVVLMHFNPIVLLLTLNCSVERHTT